MVGAVLTVAAAALHVLFFAQAGALWRDEVNGVQTASAPSLRALRDLLVYDSGPAVSYVALRLWMRFAGETDLALRAHGFFVGLLALSMLWVCARGLGRAAPVAALALAGLHPDFIRWGDSIRPFGLGVVLLLAAYASFWRLATTPGAPAAFLALVAGAASVHCAYQNVPLLAAIAAGALTVCVRQRRWRGAVMVAGAAAVAQVSLLPLLPTLMVRLAGWDRARCSLSAEAIARGLVTASNGGVAGPVWAAVLLAGFIVAWLAWHRPGVGAPGPEGAALFGSSVAAFALLGTWAFLKWLGYGVQPWYCLGLIALAALGLDSARGLAARARPAILAACVAVAVTLLPGAAASLRARQTNVDLVAAALHRSAKPGDVVLVSPWHMGVSIRRYYRGPAVIETVPPMGDQRVHRYDLASLATSSPDPLHPLRERTKTALESGHRVFLVASERPRSSRRRRAAGAPGAWDSGNYSRMLTRQVAQVLRTRSRRALPWQQPGFDRMAFTGYEVLGFAAWQGWHDPAPSVLRLPRGER